MNSVHVNICNLDTLAEAAGYIHDADFHYRDIQYDPVRGYFKMDIWVRGYFEMLLQQTKTPWRKYTLSFHQVRDYSIRVEEEVRSYETSDLLYDEAKQLLTIGCHYAMDLELTVDRIYGCLESTNITTDDRNSVFPKKDKKKLNSDVHSEKPPTPSAGVSVPAQIVGILGIMIGICTMIAGVAMLAIWGILLMIQFFFAAAGNQTPPPGMREFLMLLMWVGVIIAGFIILRIGYRIRRPSPEQTPL